MSSIFYKGLTLFFSLGLIVSVATWWKARQELEAVTAANESVRKTLGALTVAITEKDRQIDRLTRSSCDAEERAQLGSGSVATRRANR